MPIDDLCERCGGSGSEFPWYGPFLVCVPDHLRDEALDRLQRRAALLLKVDRALGGQFLKLLGKHVDEEDLLHIIKLTLERGIDAWIKGRKQDALPDFLDVLTHLLWVLEGLPADG